MNTKIKSWIYPFLPVLFLTFQSCEKDSNEEETKQAKKGEIHHLTIDEAPFLKPNVENFKSKNSLANKSSDDKEAQLELDVQHIIEYDGADDFKSYSIPVIDKSVENSDYYFENLHVIKNGDKYETIIIRYTPADDTKKFELKNFTGKMEFFNNNKSIKRTIHFVNGTATKADPVPGDKTTGKTAVLPDRQVEDDCNCNNTGGGGGSFLSDFFSWVAGLFSNITISNGYGDPSYAIGYVLTVTPPNMGSGYIAGSGNTSSGSGGSSPYAVFVPSEPQAAYQRMQVTDIVRKLGNIDSTAFLWMMDHNNADHVNNIYNALNEEEENSSERLEFLRQAVKTLKAGGNVDFWFRVIVDKSLSDNPCLYGVYTKLGQAPIFDSYLKKFDSKFSAVDLKLSVGANSNNTKANAVTYGPENYLIETKFNPDNLHRPSLDIARTFIHELIHAEIYRKLLSCSRLPNVNVNKMTDAQWQVYINNLKNNFPSLFDYYMRYTYAVPANQQISEPQHELMAQHYRQIIVQVLKQFDKNAHSDQFYNSLSWIGLMGEGIFNPTTALPSNPSVAWGKLPLSDRLNIKATYDNFINSNPPCQ